MAIRLINVFRLRGNPYLLSPDEMLADGLLTQEDLDGMKDSSACMGSFGASG